MINVHSEKVYRPRGQGSDQMDKASKQPCLAGAVLHAPVSLIQSAIHPFTQNIQNNVTPKPINARELKFVRVLFI